MMTDEAPQPEEILPRGSRVLVRLDGVRGGGTSSGGIILPDTMEQRKPDYGVVMAKGPKVDEYDDQIQVGDRVLVLKYGGVDIPLPKERRSELWLLCRAEELLGLVENARRKKRSA